ncbi:hypothetical protein KC644_02695 [Candidatus Berkelbacteria bacterium]|nr:hypothetical protein [Candidatus Berkelbacteria bacterium]
MCYRILLSDTQKADFLQRYPDAHESGEEVFYKSPKEFWILSRVANYVLFSLQGRVLESVIKSVGLSVPVELVLKRDCKRGDYYLSDIKEDEYIKMKEKVAKKFREGKRLNV